MWRCAAFTDILFYVIIFLFFLCFIGKFTRRKNLISGYFEDEEQDSANNFLECFVPKKSKTLLKIFLRQILLEAKLSMVKCSMVKCHTVKKFGQTVRSILLN